MTTTYYSVLTRQMIKTNIRNASVSSRVVLVRIACHPTQYIECVICAYLDKVYPVRRESLDLCKLQIICNSKFFIGTAIRQSMTIGFVRVCILYVCYSIECMPVIGLISDSAFTASAPDLPSALIGV